MENDYRNTRYCTPLENVEKNKKELDKRIRTAHPKAKIIYNKVKAKNESYRETFMEIYNYKCGYCGNSIANIHTNLFEIDHYICESSFDSKEDAGKIENLVLACYDCNRSKSNLLIEGKYKDILNPDYETIKNIFYRDDLYYIRIIEEFKEDCFIKKFQEKLKLGDQTRRIDFLLMNMKGMCKKYENRPEAEELRKMLMQLQEKRNMTVCR